MAGAMAGRDSENREQASHNLIGRILKLIRLGSPPLKLKKMPRWPKRIDQAEQLPVFSSPFFPPLFIIFVGFFFGLFLLLLFFF